jgi:glutamate formiminotransferase / formiminotetrahydrofolate cyclodeaminase
MKLVECVPNISEGRDKKIIEAVADEVRGVEDVELLDVDPGAATNRTVFTFVGSPQGASEAAFRLIRKAAALIDMRRHSGEHARNGAIDVCPFVPVSETSMDDCAQLARSLGERVGSELGIPVYLYEHAASRPEWRNLANVRKGEYEALADKLGSDEWKPDFGPNEYTDRVARTGATQIGARQFLIAYNINLNTKNDRYARRIGLTIRQQGGAVVRDEKGKKVRGPDGKFLKHEKGLFEHCKATGWFIEEYGVAQVTMNLTDYNVTPPHLVFDKVCELAGEIGVRVIGSEIVGLVPLEAMLQAGRHYLLEQNASPGVPDEDLIEVAVQSMGLNNVTRFDPRQRIVEYCVASTRPLVESTVAGFVDELSRDSAAPGGGSVAALNGALSAGLSGMVANLSVGKQSIKKKIKQEMRNVADKAQSLKKRLVAAVDDDTFAFNEVISAFGLPQGTPQQKEARAAAVLEANKGATLVPLSVLETIPDALELARAVGERGNQSSLSDAGVAVLAARAAAMGAHYNVLINLAGIEGDDEFVEQTRSRAQELIERVTAACDDLDRYFVDKLTSELDA